MQNIFKARTPLAATIIALFFGPVIAMCYLNKGRLALMYLLLYPLTLYLVPSILVILLFQLIGIFHGWKIAKQQPHDSIYKWYSRWYVLAFIAILAPLIIRTYCYEAFHIPSASMSPNVNQGDYLFVEKFAYRHASPQRGDIVVFKTVKMKNLPYIKRIIGMPGDIIRMSTGTLYINNQAIPRQALPDFTVHDSTGEHNVPQFIETWPEGRQGHILQELRPDTYSSTPAYTVPPHQYFVLGDNRSNSHDSRDQAGFGFIPEEAIVGKAISVYWNDKTPILQFKRIF